jgi:hypothetical protein
MTRFKEGDVVEILRGAPTDQCNFGIVVRKLGSLGDITYVCQGSHPPPFAAAYYPGNLRLCDEREASIFLAMRALGLTG